MVTLIPGSLNRGPRMDLAGYVVCLWNPVVGAGVGKECSPDVTLRGNRSSYWCDSSSGCDVFVLAAVFAVRM